MKALLVEVIKGWKVKLEHKDGAEWILEEGTSTMPPDMHIACIKRKL
jgi:hypothetical protein